MKIKLSDWCKSNGVKYLTGYRWFKAGTFPEKTSQSPSGTIFVETTNMEDSSQEAISHLLKKTKEFSNSNSSLEDFTAYILSNFTLELKHKTSVKYDKIENSVKTNNVITLELLLFSGRQNPKTNLTIDEFNSIKSLCVDLTPKTITENLTMGYTGFQIREQNNIYTIYDDILIRFSNEKEEVFEDPGIESLCQKIFLEHCPEHKQLLETALACKRPNKKIELSNNFILNEKFYPLLTSTNENSEDKKDLWSSKSSKSPLEGLANLSPEIDLTLSKEESEECKKRIEEITKPFKQSKKPFTIKRIEDKNSKFQAANITIENGVVTLHGAVKPIPNNISIPTVEANEFITSEKFNYSAYASNLDEIYNVPIKKVAEQIESDDKYVTYDNARDLINLILKDKPNSLSPLEIDRQAKEICNWTWEQYNNAVTALKDK